MQRPIAGSLFGLHCFQFCTGGFKRDANAVQLADQVLVGGGVQPLAQAFADFRANAMECRDLLRRGECCIAEGRKAYKGRCQSFGIHLADVADAEAVELAVPRLLLRLLKSGDEIGGRLLPHSLEAGEQR